MRGAIVMDEDALEVLTDIAASGPDTQDGRERGARHVETARTGGDAQAGLVEVLDRGHGADQLGDMVEEALEAAGGAAGGAPARGRVGGRRDPHREEVAHELGQAVLGKDRCVQQVAHARDEGQRAQSSESWARAPPGSTLVASTTNAIAARLVARREAQNAGRVGQSASLALWRGFEKSAAAGARRKTQRLRFARATTGRSGTVRTVTAAAPLRGASRGTSGLATGRTHACGVDHDVGVLQPPRTLRTPSARVDCQSRQVVVKLHPHPRAVRVPWRRQQNGKRLP